MRDESKAAVFSQEPLRALDDIGFYGQICIHELRCHCVIGECRPASSQQEKWSLVADELTGFHSISASQIHLLKTNGQCFANSMVTGKQSTGCRC